MRILILLIAFVFASCSDFNGVSQHYGAGYLVTEVNIKGETACSRYDLNHDSTLKRQRREEAEKIYKGLK